MRTGELCPVSAPCGARRRKAVFLDRDGALTEPRHYPSRPDDLILQPGIGPPLCALQHAGGAATVQDSISPRAVRHPDQLATVATRTVGVRAYQR
ncbi:hypothetical protein ACFY2H_39660 [Streptomyces griseofuscus]|uniref:hypothetical protein n=1 Tax=Streptomyces griseofuscus TaxID=146922 RepID=UPI003693BBAF